MPQLTEQIPKTRSDEELVAIYLQTQHSRYFERLYMKYYQKVFAKCLFFLKDESSAKDAMQEVFMKVLLNLSKFKSKARFSTWLYSITYNYCIDLLRKKKKNPLLLKDSPQEQIDYDEEINDKLILEVKIERLSEILQNLDLDDRAVLVMKYMDGMSIKEIGESFDKTDSAIKMKIKRAKVKFVRLHKQRFGDDLIGS